MNAGKPNLGGSIYPKDPTMAMAIHYCAVFEDAVFPGKMTPHTHTGVFYQDFEGLTEAFVPGRPPDYPRGRPPDIQPPKTYSLGCFFVLEPAIFAALSTENSSIDLTKNRCDVLSRGTKLQSPS